MLNYSLSGANSRAKQAGIKNSNSQYANLRPGINVGPWRLRNYTTWSRDETGEDTWDTVYTYAQRAIISLNAQLTWAIAPRPQTCSTVCRFAADNWLPTTTCCRIR